VTHVVAVAVADLGVAVVGVVIPPGFPASEVQNAAVVGVEPQASFDIALAFDVLVPASVVAV
jgi:hypothetical protein